MAHKRPTKRLPAKQKREMLPFNEGLEGRVDAVSYAPRSGLSFQRWQEVGVTLGQMARSIQWWVGDWILYGEEKFGEKYAQALDGTGRDPKTLLEWCRVVKAVPQERRVAELSFAHHETVAALEPEMQTFWLQRCLEGDPVPGGGPPEVWSARRLRAELKPPKHDDPEPVEIEVLDKAQVPMDYLVIDAQAVTKAWQEAQAAGAVLEIPGLALRVPALPPPVEAPA